MEIMYPISMRGVKKKIKELVQFIKFHCTELNESKLTIYYTLKLNCLKEGGEKN